MKPRPFRYVRATSVEHALAAFAAESDARYLAGGQSLLATLNMRLSAPNLLVDITNLSELSGIGADADVLRIGALTRYRDVETSPLIARHAPLLARAVTHVAHAAIRNRGTVGGSLAFADPAAEMPACMVALDAGFQVRGTGGTRRIAAQDFFIDLYETALQPAELLVGIDIPIRPQARFGFREFARRRGDFASAGVCGQRVPAGNGDAVRIVFFGVANTPVLSPNVARTIATLGAAAAGHADLGRSLDTDLRPIGDPYASAEMKSHLARVLLDDVIKELYPDD